MTGGPSHLALAVMLAAAPMPVVAQTGDSRPAKAEREADALPDRFGLIKGTQLQVSTGADEERATLAIALPTGAAQRDRFSLIASTPLKDGDKAKPATLDALASGAKVTLRWGRFDIGRPRFNDPGAKAISQRARGRCLADPAGRNDPELTGLGNRPCGEPDGVVYKYDLPEYRAYHVRAITSGSTDYGLEASLGINDFEWLDPATLLPQKKQKASWSVAGHLTHYFLGTLTAATFSATYQRAYEAAEEQLICPRGTTNPTQDCKKARAAAPVRKSSWLLSAGLRHRFTGGDGKLLNLAIAPLVSFDVKKHVWGVDVPVYVIPDKENALSGGIRFGYRSDRQDKFSASVFVGTTFNLLQ